MKKYVFIQNDPFYLPTVLDKYLREFCDSTVGINVQSVAQGGFQFRDHAGDKHDTQFLG